MEPTYLGEIELTDEVLEHYGVPGMKWGVRRYDNNRVSRVRNITGSASPVRRASTGNRDMSYNAQRRAITATTSSSGGTGSTVRKPVSGGTGTRDASYEAQLKARGVSVSAPVKAKAKTTTSSLLSSASGSSSSKSKSGKRSGKSEAEKAKEKAEKEEAKKKKQQEKEEAKKQKEAEKAAKAASKGSGGSAKKESSGKSSGGSSSSGKASSSSSATAKSSANEEKLKKERDAYKQELEVYQKALEELAKEKQKVQISDTYTKYLEDLLNKSNNRSQLDKINTEEVKKRWERKKNGMRHDDMENGAIMIFPEELRKPDLNDITKRGC